MLRRLRAIVSPVSFAGIAASPVSQVLPVRGY
jgi:hypothetical protein